MRMFRSWRHALFVMSSMMATGSAAALDYQLHGFATQGFVLSDGNNFFGDSTHGSYEYYEAGISGALQLRPDLLFSAQGVVRNAGATDTAKPRLDYALLDYRAFSGTESDAGVRVGKVKNPLGFYNETRDVVFTRPGILMPASVYQDNLGERRLVFSSNGAQIYGDTQLNSHDLSLIATAALDRKLSDSEEQLILGEQPFSLDLYLKKFWNVRLMDQIDGGRWCFALSHTATDLAITTDPSFGAFGRLGVQIDVASAQFNAAKFSVTGEYIIYTSKSDYTFNGMTQQSLDRSDGGYLQFDYRFTPRWSAMLRHDAYFADRNDRGGSRCADRHQCHAIDTTIGGTWRYDEHWGVWAEYHFIDGTATLQPLDNRGRKPQDHWSMLMLMAGYRF